jgi:hypothetical protein
LTELAVEVASRLHVRPEEVLRYNAAKFYGLVEALANLGREREAVADDERKRLQRKRI